MLLVKGCTLPGALDGVRYYLEPNVSRLGDPKASISRFFSYLTVAVTVPRALYSRSTSFCKVDSITLYRCGSMLLAKSYIRTEFASLLCPLLQATTTLKTIVSSEWQGYPNVEPQNINTVLTLGFLARELWIQNTQTSEFLHCFNRHSVKLVICCSLTSILAGFAVFTVVGHLAYIQDVPIANLTLSGKSFILDTYLYIRANGCLFKCRETFPPFSLRIKKGIDPT